MTREEILEIAKPILFNTGMVQAILTNCKSVTRRVVKPHHLRVLDSQYRKNHPETPDKVLLGRLCEPPYRPGDILYVRETWYYETFYEDTDNVADLPSGNRSWRYVYKADNPDYPTIPGHWRPSIHMPKEAARIFLRVTNVRVERLQDITEEQAKLEGAIDNRDFIHSPDNEYTILHSAREHYAEIWDSTIKKTDLSIYGWEANPWVWVIEFERVEAEK